MEEFLNLYGYHNITYNLHNLTHLHLDALQYCGLENISAFKFENKLQEIKYLIRPGSHPLEQTFNRLIEAITYKGNKSL